MDSLHSVLIASSLLFGFFLIGFWFALDRELRTEAHLRHFRYGYVLLTLATGCLASFGIIVPLRRLAEEDLSLTLVYKGTVIALVGILGYVLTELAHYDIFRRSEFTPKAELIIFWVSLSIMLIVSVLWLA